MKKILMRSAAVLLAILLLALLLLGGAEAAVRFQPVTRDPNPVQDLPTANPAVVVRVDPGMFTLFAALNASGYDDENYDMPYHPVRRLVRERLAGASFPGQALLRAELAGVNSYNYVVWALHYGAPPGYARLEPWKENGIPALFFFGLDGALRSFYQKYEIGALWQEVLPQYQAEAARYQEASDQAIAAVLAYTRMVEAPMEKIVIIPNLLDAHYRGYGPQVGGSAYVVVGPTGGKPDVGLVQHEAMHSIAGPLVQAGRGAIDPARARALFAAQKDLVPPGYSSWESLLEEQVVRALDCRLHLENCRAFLLEQDEQAGFLLERSLVEKLAEYEADDATLAEYMPSLLGALNELSLP